MGILRFLLKFLNLWINYVYLSIFFVIQDFVILSEFVGGWCQLFIFLNLEKFYFGEQELEVLRRLLEMFFITFGIQYLGFYIYYMYFLVLV